MTYDSHVGSQPEPPHLFKSEAEVMAMFTPVSVGYNLVWQQEEIAEIENEVT
jgi:hypothetical protein